MANPFQRDPLDPAIMSARREAAKRLAEQQEQKRGSIGSTIGSIGGAIIGGYFGGPQGAAAGAKAGGQLGGSVAKGDFEGALTGGLNLKGAASSSSDASKSGQQPSREELAKQLEEAGLDDEVDIDALIAVLGGM